MTPSKFLSWLVMSLCVFYGAQPVFPQTDLWMQTNGPFGGNVNALAIDSNGDIFAGTEGGVFRSSDNGENWSPTGLTSIRVFALAVDDSGHILAGTGEVGFPYMGGGVFRSTDNGDNWMAAGLTHARVLSLAINASGDLFAGRWLDGVYRSTDNGENWVQTNAGLANLDVRALAISASGDIFAGTGDGAFRSTKA